MEIRKVMTTFWPVVTKQVETFLLGEPTSANYRRCKVQPAALPFLTYVSYIAQGFSRSSTETRCGFSICRLPWRGTVRCGAVRCGFCFLDFHAVWCRAINPRRTALHRDKPWSFIVCSRVPRRFLVRFVACTQHRAFTFVHICCLSLVVDGGFRCCVVFHSLLLMVYFVIFMLIFILSLVILLCFISLVFILLFVLLMLSLCILLLLSMLF